MDTQGGQLRGGFRDLGAHRSLLQNPGPLGVGEKEQLHREAGQGNRN